MAISTCSNKVSQQGRELSEHGTPSFPAGCYLDNLQQEPTPWHWHDELEAVIVVSGVVCVSVGEDNYTVRAGDGFFINANHLHAVWPIQQGECLMHSLVFHPRLIAGGMDSIFWQRYVQPLITETACRFARFSETSYGTADPVEQTESNNRAKADSAAYSRLTHSTQGEIISCIRHAWSACAEEPAGYEFEVRNALSRVIFLLSDAFSHSVPNSRISVKPVSRKAIRDEERIKRMLEYIQTNYSEDLTMAGIAASADISESECLRCFHTTIGIPPIQYVKQFRIQEAAHMLVSTDNKIADIALACGFRNISYFTKAFRERKGVTPGDYRKQKGSN